MATGNPLNIIILSQKTPRAAAISTMIRDGLAENADILIHNIAEIEKLKKTEKPDVCIVDLMSSDHTVQALISRIKEYLPGARIIALHIYTSPELIRPLIAQGVDGYLAYDPHRRDLIQAIRDVAAGNKYLPDQIEIR